MIIRPGDSVVIRFTTSSPSTGQATDADSTPAGTLVRNGVDTVEGVTVANVDTGDYSASFTIPAGYQIGDDVELLVVATVGGVTGKEVVWRAQVDTRLASDIDASTFPAGAVEFTYTVTNSASSQPVAGVDVWISTDLAGTNVVWRGTTDAFGVARNVNDQKPMLDPGTYHVWKQVAGFEDDDNPDTVSVS